MATPIGPDPGMSLKEQIVFMEAQTWEALKKSGSALQPYLAPDCVMIFPGGTIFDSESDPALNEILNRSDVKPWTHYEMNEVRVVSLGAESAMICYSVEAKRHAQLYEALISSVWRKATNNATWQMVLHQQTPVNVH